VRVGLLVGVSVGVLVGVRVGVCVGVAVGVRVGVLVGVRVGVGVSILPAQPLLQVLPPPVWKVSEVHPALVQRVVH